MAVRLIALVLALVSASGCLGGAGPAAPAEAPPPGGPAPLAWRFAGCETTLHVWLVPLDELRARTPPEFPPAVLREQGLVDTLLGRVVFYLYDCGSSAVGGDDWGRSLLGLLGIRVVPPASVAPPAEAPAWATTPWATMYVLQVVGRGAAADEAARAGLDVMRLDGSVDVRPGLAPDVPEADAWLAREAEVLFQARMQGLPAERENFSRPERYYRVDGTELRWLDVSFLSTLWETEGRVEYPEGSPWHRAVGNRAYDFGVDHHAMLARFDLAWNRTAWPLGAR